MNNDCLRDKSIIIWNKYPATSPRPKTPHIFCDIPCLVKMSDGEIWSAVYVFDFDYHRQPFTGWQFRSFWGDYYCWEEDSDYAGRSVVAFAYLDR